MKFRIEKKEEEIKRITIKQSINDINIFVDGNIVAWFSDTGKFIVDKSLLKSRGIEAEIRE